jgi:hypothetical protein
MKENRLNGFVWILGGVFIGETTHILFHLAHWDFNFSAPYLFWKLLIEMAVAVVVSGALALIVWIILKSRSK